MGGKGKRGGGRAIYFVLLADDVIFLLLAYSKAVQEDLSEAQKKTLQKIISEVTQ